MGAPGSPGGFDLQHFFRGPPQSPFPSQSAGHQPSSPGNSFHHQPPNSSYAPGNFSPNNFPSNSSAYSNHQGSNYSYITNSPQQPSSPVHHPPFMHYAQEHGPRPVPYPSSPFNPQPSQFSQPGPPSSPSHSNLPQSFHPMSSTPLSSQLTSSQSLSSQPMSPQPLSSLAKSSLPQGSGSNPASTQPLDGARLMALLTTQSAGEGMNDEEETLSFPVLPQNSPKLSPSSFGNAVVSYGSGAELSGPPPPISPALPTAPPVNSAPPSALGKSPTRFPRGRHLRGDNVVYDVDARKPGEAQPQLEVTPITVYVSDPVPVLGRQIAVNKNYICYGLRAGNIRILNINSAQKALLRGHTQRVTDMAFFSEDVHLLASASADGRIYVRKILEGNGEDGKLTDQVLLAIQIIGDWETCHPRLCWHSHMQDFLAVAIGKFVVKIDVNKARQAIPPGGFNADQPLECRVENPLKGVFVVGVHDEEVTDVAIPISGSARLASASKDGTVRIWGEKKPNPLSVFLPYDGETVCALAFISSPPTADRHVLLTAGPLNRELKLWALEELPSKSGQGVWRCIQTLELQCSAANGKLEASFYNQVFVASRAGLILLANAKKNAIYAIHVNFGPSSVAPRFDYLAEFSVTMPILSLIATEDGVTEGGDGTLKVFCVQTQAIQQYALDSLQCLPPTGDESHSEGSTPSTLKKGLGVPQAPCTPTSSPFSTLEKSSANLMTTASTLTGVSNAPSMSSNPGIPPRPSAFGSLVELGSRGLLNVTTEITKGTETTKLTNVVSSRDGPGKPSTPTYEVRTQLNNRLSTRPNTRPEIAREGLSSSNLTKPPTPPPRRRSRSRSPAKAPDMQYVPVYTGILKPRIEKQEEVKDIWLESEAAPAAAGDVANSSSSSNSTGDDFDKEEGEGGSSASSSKPSNLQLHGGPHLVSPSELMSLANRPKLDGAPIEGVAPDLMDVEDWQDEARSSITADSGKPKSANAVKEKEARKSESLLLEREDVEDPSASSLVGSYDGQMSTNTEFIEKEMMSQNDGEPTAELGLSTSYEPQDGDLLDDRERPMSLRPDDLQDQVRGMGLKLGEAVGGVPAMPSQLSSAAKGRKSKNKTGGASVPLPPSTQLPIMPSPPPMTMSEGENTGSSTTVPLWDSGLAAQVASLQESLNQLVTMQKELQKQMTVMVAVPVTKEGKRMEGALGQRMEKVLKAHVDAMWARLAEENAKREKLEREKVQQVTTLLTNFISKEMPAALERGLKKEVAAIGPAVVQAIVPPLQKAIQSAVTEAFQKGFLEKLLPQLEKTVIAKLEVTVTRQLQSQFQTVGRQALQESLRSGFDSLIIPSFERSCRTMFEQVDSTFQKGMAEHTSAAQQQFASSHTALASNLQEVIERASSLANVLGGELQDSTNNLLEVVKLAGANEARNEVVKQNRDTLPDKVLSLRYVEASLDPTIELTRLLQQGKFEDALNISLQLGNLQVVSWLCHQMDPVGLFAAGAQPMSQGVILALIQQLSCDLNKDTGHKLLWIKEAALALDPNDPQLHTHVRSVLEHVYQSIHQLIGFTKVQRDHAPLRLVLHVVNSMLSALK